MPKNPPTGWAAYPRLGDCARANMLIVCNCRQCRRSVTYLAADLLEHFKEMSALAGRLPGQALVDFRIVGELWGRCPRCGSTRDWSERERYASHEDVGHTMIRRPNGFRQVRLWRDEWYGPPVKSDAS